MLTDPTGLHLSAGPYFLIYSQAVPEAEEQARTEWPENLKNSVKHNNRTFLAELPAELAARVVDPNSPPTSPRPGSPPTPSSHTIETQSSHTIESDVVEPPESRGEPMDTSVD